jgi:hypothetical protein
MIRQLRRDNRLARPVLEVLENREVPAGAVGSVTAAVQDAAVQIPALQVSAATGNYANANAILQTVSNDFAILQSNASGLDTGSRIQVDNALISNGMTLLSLGINILPQNPSFGFNLYATGVNAIFAGYLDEMITSQISGASDVMA